MVEGWRLGNAFEETGVVYSTQEDSFELRAYIKEAANLDPIVVTYKEAQDRWLR